MSFQPPADAARPGSASDEARAANERIAASAALLRFVSSVPFVCECSDGRCAEAMLLRLDEYAALRAGPSQYLTIPEHTVHRADILEKRELVWVHVVR